jgi:hypothetical protein
VSQEIAALNVRAQRNFTIARKNDLRRMKWSKFALESLAPNRFEGRGRQPVVVQTDVRHATRRVSPRDIASPSPQAAYHIVCRFPACRSGDPGLLDRQPAFATCNFSAQARASASLSVVLSPNVAHPAFMTMLLREYEDCSA